MSPLLYSRYSYVTVALWGLLITIGCSSETIESAPGNFSANFGDYRSEPGEFGVVRLDWGHVKGATAYEIERADVDEGSGFQPIHWGSDTNFEDHAQLRSTGFIPGNRYLYRVRAHSNSAGFGPWSGELAVNIPPFRAPTGLAATWIDNRTAIRLSWEPVDVAGVQYEILRKDDNSNSFHGLEQVDASDGTVFEDSYYLEPGYTYYYRVMAVHEQYGSSPLSPVVSVDPRPLAAPHMVDASQGNSYTIMVRVEAIYGAEYELVRSEGDPDVMGSYERVWHGGLNRADGYAVYEDHDVAPGRLYHYRARAVMNNLEGPVSENYVTGWAGEDDPQVVPPAPQNLFLFTQGTSVRVRWQPSPVATTYRIYRLAYGSEVDPNGVEERLDDFELIADLEREYPLHSNYLEHWDPDLDSGRVYLYFMRAVNAHGESGATPVKDVLVGDGAEPGRPEPEASDGDYSNAIVISWPPVDHGDWYRVYRGAFLNEVVAEEPVSPWIRGTSFIHHPVSSSVTYVVQARSERGVLGRLSSMVTGRVDLSAPEYDGDGPGGDPGGEPDPPPVDMVRQELGEVPLQFGQAGRPINVMRSVVVGGDLVLAAVVDPGYVYDYGYPSVARYANGNWESIPAPPSEMTDRPTINNWIDVAAAADGRIWLSALDDDQAFLYEYDGADSWGANLLGDNLGLAERPASVSVAWSDGSLYAAYVTPDSGRLRVVCHSGTGWDPAVGDGWLTAGGEGGEATDAWLQVSGGNLYIIYVVPQAGGDTAAVHIKQLEGSSWKRELEWSINYNGMRADNPKVTHGPAGALYFRLGSVYKVTSPTTVENVQPGWCNFLVSIAGNGSGANGGGELFLACLYWDEGLQSLFSVVGVGDESGFGMVEGDYTGVSRPAEVAGGDGQAYFIHGDMDHVPDQRNESAVMRAVHFSLE